MEKKNCLNRHIKEFMESKKNNQKICKRCGERFVTTMANKIFCKPLCRNRFYRKTHTGKKYYTPYMKMRFQVLKRDNFTCQYCGHNVKDGRKLVIDHIHPKKKGGLDSLNNLVVSCSLCNGGKADILIEKRNNAKE